MRLGRQKGGVGLSPSGWAGSEVQIPRGRRRDEPSIEVCSFSGAAWGLASCSHQRVCRSRWQLRNMDAKSLREAVRQQLETDRLLGARAVPVAVSDACHAGGRAGSSAPSTERMAAKGELLRVLEETWARTVATPWAWNPGSTRVRSRRLRPRTPAVTRRTTVRATSAATRTDGAFPLPPTLPLPPR